MYAVTYDKDDATEKNVKQADEKPIITGKVDEFDNQHDGMVRCDKLPLLDMESAVALIGIYHHHIAPLWARMTPATLNCKTNIFIR